jgi:PadR family transcriptional regulator PadR
MNVRYERQLKRGVLEIVVLKMISREPTYGYQLLGDMDRISEGLFKIKEGTLYPILYRLEDDGLIRSEWSVPKDKDVSKKYYVITDQGEAVLKELIELWSEFDRITGKILEG